MSDSPPTPLPLGSLLHFPSLAGFDGSNRITVTSTRAWTIKTERQHLAIPFNLTCRRPPHDTSETSCHSTNRGRDHDLLKLRLRFLPRYIRLRLVLAGFRLPLVAAAHGQCVTHSACSQVTSAEIRVARRCACAWMRIRARRFPAIAISSGELISTARSNFQNCINLSSEPKRRLASSASISTASLARPWTLLSMYSA